MRDFLLSLKIRVKLLAAFGSILLLSVLLIVFSLRSINTILSYKEVNEEVDLLKLRYETLSLNAKEFLYEGYKSKEFLEGQKSNSIDVFRASYLESKEIIQKIGSSGLTNDPENKKMLDGLTITLDSLQTEFNTLVELLRKRGFKDFGSEGALRNAIHQVENSGFTFDKASMLTLRRHEKDFFLRKDLKYQDDFNNSLSDFRSQLQNNQVLTGLILYLDNYQSEFNKVVEIEKKIGLKENEGIRGRVKRYFDHIRPQLDSFRAQIKERNQIQIVQTKIILGIMFAVQIIAGLVMALVYANLLTKSIKEIRGAMQKLASGIFPDKLNVRTTEEIGQTKQAFNQFVDRLKAATTFAEQIGAGSKDSSYDSRYSDDVLARSLIQAQQKLTDADERQSKINWANQGAAAFNDILKNENDQINLLADSILKLLVSYVNANQGALYLIVQNDEGKYLERISTYAYGKKKYDTHRVNIGEGIIGQCVLEGSPVFLKEIPKDFVKITSGLGEATPRSVLIVPLKVRSLVMGVIELASFGFFENYHIEFIERIAESIATILSNKQTSEETKQLLSESQQRASALVQQEEEMRQNSEELLATQEEMERQRKAMQDEIKELKQKLKDVEQKTFA